MTEKIEKPITGKEFYNRVRGEGFIMRDIYSKMNVYNGYLTSWIHGKSINTSRMNAAIDAFNELLEEQK